MSARFITIDRDTPMLLPFDLRAWVPDNHLVHVIVDAVEHLPMAGFKVNLRGTGDKQYPPAMMLSLLIYSYATGRFSSREIEAATYSDVIVRYICGGDTHPDHDTICTFRRENGQAFELAFVKVLGMARELGVLKACGGASVDGTKISANASKHAAVSYKRAGEMIAELQQEVQLLMVKAEEADNQDRDAAIRIPEEIARREKRREKLEEARRIIEDRFMEKQQEEQAEYEARQAKRDAARKEGKKPGGPDPKPPAGSPDDKAQFNFTDPDSRIMKAGNGQHFEQAYNAQAAVDTEGSMLIIGQRVTNHGNDKQELVPTVAAVDPGIRQLDKVLADTGFYSDGAVAAIPATCYIAVGKQSHHRSIDAVLHPSAEPAVLPADAEPIDIMRHRLATPAGKAIYGKRKQTVEPVFGIIKEAMGFRRFLLRGLGNVSLEWTLVTLAYNLRRLFSLKNAKNTRGDALVEKPTFAAMA